MPSHPRRPPSAPPAPRPRLIPEWRAPWLQDPQFLRPDDRRPPYPEFDDDVELHLHRMRHRPTANLMGLHDVHTGPGWEMCADAAQGTPEEGRHPRPPQS